MTIWANNPNYVRKAAHPANVSNDDLKRGAEKRMAFYDAQPKTVRAEIGEIGMLDSLYKATRTRQVGRSAKDRVAYIRSRYAVNREIKAVQI